MNDFKPLPRAAPTDSLPRRGVLKPAIDGKLVALSVIVNAGLELRTARRPDGAANVITSPVRNLLSVAATRNDERAANLRHSVSGYGTDEPNEFVLGDGKNVTQVHA